MHIFIYILEMNKEMLNIFFFFDLENDIKH